MSEQYDIHRKVICHCSCTTEQQILRLIEEGFDTLEVISSKTGAAAGCGACETWIQELLAQQAANFPHVP